MKIGKLDCLCRPGESDKKNVVLLHGFGADASDLFPLADFLDADQQFSFYFPEAPLHVAVGPGMMGRAWFPISVRELEQGIDFTQLRPPGMDASRELVNNLVFHLESEQLVLGGFSQGAMVATEVALNNPEDVHGLILYSAALLDQANWSAKAASLSGRRLLQSHGTQDTVIPYAAGQKLYTVLKDAGMEGSLISFRGGHEIPLQVLEKTKELLKQLK